MMVDLLILIGFHVCWMIFWNKVIKWYWDNNSHQADGAVISKCWYLLMTPVLGEVMITVTILSQVTKWVVSKL